MGELCRGSAFTLSSANLLFSPHWGVPSLTGGPLHLWSAPVSTRYLSYMPSCVLVQCDSDKIRACVKALGEDIVPAFREYSEERGAS